MSLGFGILGFLNYAPMSGYDLAKAFESSLQFFWHAQKNYIYLELKKLEQKGISYVTSRYKNRVKCKPAKINCHCCNDTGPLNMDAVSWLFHGMVCGTVPYSWQAYCTHYVVFYC